MVNLGNIINLIIVIAVIGLFISLLFRLRVKFGFAFLFVVIGIFQYFQNALAKHELVQISDTINISFGSAVLFPVTIFLILIIYIIEDAKEARKMIYGIIFANILAIILSVIYQLVLNSAYEIHFAELLRITVSGLTALVIDSLLIIILFEKISKSINNLFLRIVFTVIPILVLDNVLFITGIFWNKENYYDILISSASAKVISGFLYSLIFTGYLLLFERGGKEKESIASSDMFQFLTYRQKYESLYKVTEKLIAEKDKVEKESEKKFKEIFDSVSEAVLIHDAETGRVLDVNKTMVEMFGYKSKEEALEVNVNMFKSGDDKYSMERALELLHSVKTEGEFSFEWKTTTRTGKEFWCDVALKPAVIGNRNVVIANVRDLTEEKAASLEIKKSEANLRAYIDNVDSGIWAIDTEYNLMLANKFFIENYGKVFHVDIKIGMNIFTLVPEDFIAFFKPKYTSALNGEYVKFEYSLPIDNENRSFEIKFNPIFLENKIIGVSAISLDTTEIKSVSNKISELYNRNAMILNTMLDGFILMDENAKIIQVNPSYCKMIGYSEEELLKMTVWDLEENQTAGEESRNEQWTPKEGSVQFKSSQRHKDGHIVKLSVNISVIEGKETLSAAFIRDITEENKLLKALEESELRFRTAFKTSPDSININRVEDGLYIDINEGFENISGYSREDVIGKTSLEINIWNNSEDRERLLKGLKENGIVNNLEAEFRMKDGSIVIGLMSAQVINLNGVPHILSITRDITERKKTAYELIENEQKYRTIVNESPLGIFHYTNEGVIIHCNEIFVDIIGSSKEALIGLNMLTMLKNEEIKQGVKKSLSEGSAYYEGLYASVTADKKTYVRIHFKGIKNNKGEIISGLGVVEDYTEKKKAQDALRESESLNKVLFQYSYIPLVVMEPDTFKFIDCNEAAVKIYGFKNKEEAIGKTPADVSFPTQYDGEPSETASAEKIKTALERGAVIFEWKHQRPDGEIWDAKVHLMKFEYNGKTLLQFSLLDITEQRENDKQINFQARLLDSARNAIIASSDLTIQNQLNNVITYWNRAAEKLYGWKAKEVIGKNMRDVIPIEFENTDNEEVNRLVRENGSWEGETIQFDKYGNKKHIHLFISAVYDDSGKIIGSFGINQDITERRKIESALINSRQMLMEAENLGGLGSWQWDRESGSLLWSEEMFRIWEIEKGKAPKTLDDFLNFIYDEDRETSINLTNEAFKENDTVEFQYRIIDGAGKLKYIQARTKAEKNEDDEITHLLGVVQDVTKWVETNSDLEKSRTILRNLTDHLQQLREDEKKNIARELHDELGQMLTALKIDMRNILTENSNINETRLQLEEQVKNIDNIITTTRSLIQQLRPAILDDLGLTSAVEWLVSELRKRTDIIVNLRISPLELELEENMKVGLYRSIQETLNNVIKHSKASIVEINITKSDNLVIIDVKDNGIGFEPDKVSTESSMGLLGLKERIWIMGGNVEIKSKKNAGTSIHITVPISRSSS